jgi:Uma2 family endonuclease
MAERSDTTTDGEEEGEMTAILDQGLEQPRLLSVDLPDGYAKAEIVGGAIVMSPLRSAHNKTLHRLMSQLDAQLPAELAYVSDVLTPFPRENHEFCPDLAVVPKAVDEENVSVCPADVVDVVFEIVSMSTRDIDYSVKVGVYARSGIAEYVIFDPYTRSATRYAHPEEGEYTLREVVHYGKPVRLDLPFPCVIETAELPVDPKPQD